VFLLKCLNAFRIFEYSDFELKQMMDLKAFALAVSQISEEKGLSAAQIVDSIETALAAAYKKEYGEKSQVIKAKLDAKSGTVLFWQVKP